MLTFAIRMIRVRFSSNSYLGQRFFSKSKFTENLDESYLLWQLEKMKNTVEKAYDNKVDDSSIDSNISKMRSGMHSMRRSSVPNHLLTDAVAQKLGIYNPSSRPVGMKVKEGLKVNDKEYEYVEPLPTFHWRDGSVIEELHKSNNQYNFRDATPSQEDAQEFSDDPFKAYESTKWDGARQFNDLTHEETKKLQELRMRRAMLEKRIRWMKTQMLPDPEKEAKNYFKKLDIENKNRELQKEHQLYPPPVMEVSAEIPGSALMVRKTAEDELVSRLRHQIREQKKKQSAAVKQQAPPTADRELVVDPITLHVQRRAQRVKTLLMRSVQEFISTAPTPRLMYDFLGGASVAINKMKVKRARRAVRIYYDLLSNHDAGEVQERMNKAAPQFRLMLARKLNLGHTPELRFIANDKNKLMNKNRLTKQIKNYATRMQTGYTAQKSFENEMGK